MKYLIKNKYWNIVEDYNVDKLLYLLVDRPNYIYTKLCLWCSDIDANHRNYDLPAVINNGYFAWYKHNTRYREHFFLKTKIRD